MILERTTVKAGQVDPRGTIHTVCPYFTMFPLRFPLETLSRHAREGGWVLDPFCGRGTTNFAARMLGLPSYGVDSSPVAAAIALAKLPLVSTAAVLKAAERALRKEADVVVPRGEFWRRAFSPGTLRDICRLRQALTASCERDEQVVLRAVLLGILHGPRNRGLPTYLSNQAPRTYAPKPQYAAGFWRRHRMSPPRVDVLELVARRCECVLAHQYPPGQGRVALGDSRKRATYPRGRRFRWIVTSPPYYGLRTYQQDQWLRLWFLGGHDTVDYSYPSDSVRHTGPEVFADDLRAVWTQCARSSSPGARMIVRFGSIRDREVDPAGLLRHSLRDTGWAVRRISDAGDAHRGKRQAEQFVRAPARALREIDLHARLEG